MLRKALMNKKKPGKEKITWRSHEILRIEAFSDGVMAFIISLLIVSLEVPKNSTELIEAMFGFLPFSICFVFVIYIWYSQYRFFRRFGLHDLHTIILNAALIFMVLLYVFPLKFTFNSIFFADKYRIEARHIGPLTTFYNAGLTIIDLIFALMYYHAYRMRDTLKLTAIEVFETRTIALDFLVLSSVTFTATAIAFYYTIVNPAMSQSCFMAYSLLGILLPLVGYMRDRKFRQKFGDLPGTEPAIMEET